MNSSKVFVTGASGYLGSAISDLLVRAGYEVIGLTRDARSAEQLSRAGIQPAIGDLTKPETFVGVLKNCDLAVHAAYADAEPNAAAIDQRALEAFADAAEDGRLRRLLYTSGIWVHGDARGEVIDDASPLAPLEVVTWRAPHEEVVLDLGQHEVVPVVFRPGIVYGGRGGFMADWFREAKETGTVTYPGDGSQYWPLVHRNDVADAYRLGLEHAAAGDRFLLADGSAHTVREIAEAIAAVTGATAQPLPAEELIATLGAAGAARLSSTRVNAARARRELGWVPRHASFVQEVEAMFREWQSPREARVS